MSIKQLSVFAENKPGAIVEITDALASRGIDIRAMSIADTQNFGVLRLIVSDVNGARDALREIECIVSVTEVVCVEMSDRPGSLADIIKLLAENGINIEYMYAFVAVSRDHAYTVFRVSNNERTEALLAEAGVKVASEDMVKGL
jgi:hypothetical protein